MKPPDIVRYFVRVKDNVLGKFAKEHGMGRSDRRLVEDEFLFRNSFQINRRFYASLGDKRAFVLSHARDLVIFKIVGYAEKVVKYYGLTDMRARIWIAHQRYPTKGRVWHPAGAHPVIGMNEALVHNGDFANYFGVTEYLRQRNLVPLFLTDTEVSVLLFDLLTRVYGYPLEYVIEAMAPTTEIDFDALPERKKKIYRAIQAQHMHGSPDGPWFFIIARSDPGRAARMPELSWLISHHGSANVAARHIGVTPRTIGYWRVHGVSPLNQAAVASAWSEARQTPRTPVRTERDRQRG